MSVLHFNKEHGSDTWHPTQKPVSLLRWLIRTYTNENDVVLDNCMGSGSTIIAAIKEKRQWIGIEKNDDYFEKAKQRIEIEQKTPTLF
jgi:site-specific DNA-methyltransferase (adenine-specific)